MAVPPEQCCDDQTLADRDGDVGDQVTKPAAEAEKSGGVGEFAKSPDVGERHFAAGAMHPTAPLELVKLPRNHLAGGAEFGRKLVMGQRDTAGRTAELQQFLRKAKIDALEGDLLDDDEKIGDPPGICGEHEPPEDGRAGDQVIENGARNGNCPNIGLGQSLGAVVLIG